MTYDPNKRRQKERERDLRIADLYTRYPDLEAMDHAQADLALRLMRLVASQAKPSEVRSLEDQAQKVSRMRDDFLSDHNIDPGIYIPDWDCVICEDLGQVGGKPCHCQKESQTTSRFQHSGLPHKLTLMSFANLDLSVYQDPGDMAGKVARLQVLCQALAAKEPMGNLIFTGGVGRGKTHLAAAVANCLLEQGGRVRYWRVDDFLDSLRRVKYEEDLGEGDRFFRDLKEVDLLILDDLGAETLSEFSLNQLQRVIEDRNLANKTWIICTNLAINAIEARYDSRLADRLFEKTAVFRLESPQSYRLKGRSDDVHPI